MTPAQLEHLRRLDAHLAALINLAAKRTPGEWHEGYSIVGDGVSVTVCNAPQPLETLGKNWTVNRAFISSCAGNAEAGWRSTKAAIADWLTLYNSTEGYADGAPDASTHDRLCNEVASICRINLNHILTAWPIEKLKLP